MKTLHYIAESSFGVTPATTLSWGANCGDLKGKFNKHHAFYPIEVGRSNFMPTTDSWDAGFSVKAVAQTVSGGYDWRQLWALYGMGATTGLTDHLGSFSAQTGKTVGGTHKYNLYNGCKINKLTMSSERAGAPIMFEADVVAQWFAASTTKTYTGLQSVTVGADPTTISTPLLCWSGALQRNIAAGGLVTWSPNNWKLTVDNKIKRHYGNIQGADAAWYSLAVALPEDEREIMFECTLPHEDETYIAAKMADSAMTAITIPVGAQTITLSNGTILLEDSDFPEYKQALMEEIVRVRFPTLSIA
jgi:hypothetical protein